MPSLLDPASRQDLCRRVDALRPDAPARWGRFTAPAMLAHLVQSLRMTAGELTVAPEPVPWLLSHWPMKHLLIHVLPFPRGMGTFPELLAREGADAGGSVSEEAWAEEKRAFRAALDAVGARDPEAEWPAHGAFGPLTGREWGVLQYRHLDHHLRQFRC